MSCSRIRPLVLTFDAFGTIFHPRQAIGQQYADAARTHGLTGFTNQDVEASFRKAFQSTRQAYPNYGKSKGMDPKKWWANVIHATFSPLLSQKTAVPADLVAFLFRRFASSEGYCLYEDVVPFFKQLYDWRIASATSETDLSRIQVGIISNSDGQRVCSILDSLGIHVNQMSHNAGIVKSTEYYDVDWVVTSFDSGHEKPSHKIFDAAKTRGASIVGGESEYLHVGDSIKEDYHAALGAGWQSVLLDRDGKYEKEVPKVARVADLTMLMQRLKARKKS